MQYSISENYTQMNIQYSVLTKLSTTETQPILDVRLHRPATPALDLETTRST